eukprot:CAMPEP_0183379434 /NCGR_PEP_ID=MMETSP0164_2-20130417/125425_1 /TAXON_ID=221442 /ORGANISM="Coccolithus pelagicus ssp braarudi, Strain PLY182g" /LENGTH=248 /DNA_ID=CAMNT_0025557017 /DNA_START=369 /DNA_END=1115 /DNA_ORIENTATION=+
MPHPWGCARLRRRGRGRSRCGPDLGQKGTGRAGTCTPGRGGSARGVDSADRPSEEGRRAWAVCHTEEPGRWCAIRAASACQMGGCAPLHRPIRALGKAPHAHGVVVGARGEHMRITRVPSHRVDAAGMPRQHLKQRAVVPVPDVDLRVLGATDDHGVVEAAEGRTDDEAALLLPSVLLEHVALVHVPRVDLLGGDVEEEEARVGGEREGRDRAELIEAVLLVCMYPRRPVGARRETAEADFVGAHGDK